MKKTWIKIKRGLLEPKHRERMGTAVWLYLYILDMCDWDTGSIHNWKDEYIAEDLDMNMTVLRRNRRKLEGLGYITCELRRTCQVVTIINWTNPREYSGELYNEGVNNSTTLGSTNVNTQGGREVNTPSYNPHLKESHIKELKTLFHLWSEHFPDKQKPRETNKTIPKLFATRLKEKEFLGSYEQALSRASRSNFINGWSGFTLQWFLGYSKGEPHWQRCYDGNYDNNGGISRKPASNSGYLTPAEAAAYLDGEINGN